MLGLGIDESTAVIVRENLLEVVGASKVAVYTHEGIEAGQDPPYFFLEAGDRYNLRTLRRE